MAPVFSETCPLFSGMIQLTLDRMEVEVRHLEMLLNQLKEKTNQPLDTKGFRIMEDLTGVKQKYLYESIYLRVQDSKKQKIMSVKLQETKLDPLAKFLGFKNFNVFVGEVESPQDPVLTALVGNYYSYVRRNDDKDMIIRSPVRIDQVEGKFWYILGGPTWTYKGKLTLRNGALFVLMEAEGEKHGKIIHHVYKIGARLKPDALQGIFSGVSTNFDPIGGRTVLLRINDAFENLTGKEFKIADLMKSKDLSDKKIAAYLKDYARNNLKLNRVVTFEVDDLID